MNSIEIREMNTDELDVVSGGRDVGPYKDCGDDGLRLRCRPTYGDLIQIVQDIVVKGQQIQQQFGGPK